MTLVVRRPADFRRLSQMFDTALNGWPFATEPGDVLTAAWIPPTDVFEDAEGIKISVELPGLSRDDVRLTLEHHTLTIRGEKKQVAEEKTTKVHRYERSYGVFERSFTLPDTLDGQKIDARFENGVLTVSLPKAEQARPREIPVTVK